MNHPAALDAGQQDVDDLRQRLRNTRWPERWPSIGWEAGTAQDDLRRLVAYWADGFDWPAQQRRAASLPWHVADLDGASISYLLFEAEREGGLPVVLTNGWPSTALDWWMSPSGSRTHPASAAMRRPRSRWLCPPCPGFPSLPSAQRWAIRRTNSGTGL